MSYSNPNDGSKENVPDPRTGVGMNPAGVDFAALDAIDTYTPDQVDKIDAILDAPVVTLADPTFDRINLQQLAAEVARKIFPYDVICRRFGISLEAFVILCKQDGFKQMVTAARALWDSSQNASERVRTFMQVGCAMGADQIASIVTDPRATTAQKMDAFKLMAETGGLKGPGARPSGGVESGAHAGSTFAVNISFDGKTVTMSTQSASSVPEPPMIEGESE